MKKVLWSLAYLVIAALIVLPKSIVHTSMAVTLPPELIALIGFGCLVAITYLLRALGAWIGIDVTGYAAQIAAGISALIVTLINYGLGLVPAAYDNLLTAVMTFLVILAGGLGTYSILFGPFGFLRKK